MKRIASVLLAVVLLFGFLALSSQSAVASPENHNARHWQTDRHRHHHHKHHNSNYRQRVPDARSLRKESW